MQVLTRAGLQGLGACVHGASKGETGGMTGGGRSVRISEESLGGGCKAWHTRLWYTLMLGDCYSP